MMQPMSEDTAKQALRNAFENMSGGPSASVSPADHDILTERFHELAEELRSELRPDSMIEWADDGSLRIAPGL